MIEFKVVCNLEEKIIAKYKLKESIKARFKKIGDEDLANDIIEYINLLIKDNYDNSRKDY